MPNRLAAATSPYLQQHRDNPVDWWEWQPEAFARARERDVPVLLSIGYSACHWCHVMAHESFEDAEVAEVINAGFVAVKVDREERPDIDAIYMAATTATTGHGGWPMTVFITPEGEPFYCGTYFPRAQLLQLLAGVSAAWRDNRTEIVSSGARIAEAIRAAMVPRAGEAITTETLAGAVAGFARQLDTEHAGFGRAPKFPPSMVLEFLLRHHGRTGDPTALHLASATCGAMARGGIYDQLDGGFARYAVDAAWVVPHFEKMLYDNAQLARVYAHWWRSSADPLARRIAAETAEFIVRDLGTEEGGFASALDADTDGVEGLTYSWTPAQLADVLGPDGAAVAARLFEVTDAGTFEHGASTLQLLVDPSGPDEREVWADLRRRLSAARAARPQPGRDDKVVTSWNGLAIAALAEVGTLLDEPRFVEAARRCAEFVLATHLVDGRLRRSSRDGRVGSAMAVADDHGNLAEGLLVLHQATGEAHWLEAARSLLETAIARFGSGSGPGGTAGETGGAGAFHDTADDAEALFARPHGSGDNAEPSGQSAIAGALLMLGALTGEPRYLAVADAAIDTAGGLAAREPRFAGWSLAVAEARAAGPVQVAVVGSGSEAAALLRRARRSPSPGLVAVLGDPDAVGVPLLAGRPLVGGGAAAYVCRGFVCDLPVTTVDDLEAALHRP